MKVVQETARSQAARFQGQCMEALVEGVDEKDPSMVTGRLSNNTIVHLPGDSSLVGRLVNVSLDQCRGFYYMGHCIE